MTELDPSVWTRVAEVMNHGKQLQGSFNTEGRMPSLRRFSSSMLKAPKTSVRRFSNPEGAPSLSGVMCGGEHVEIQHGYVAWSLEPMAGLSSKLEQTWQVSMVC